MSEIPRCDACGKACLPEELTEYEGQLLCVCLVSKSANLLPIQCSVGARL